MCHIRKRLRISILVKVRSPRFDLLFDRQSSVFKRFLDHGIAFRGVEEALLRPRLFIPGKASYCSLSKIAQRELLTSTCVK